MHLARHCSGRREKGRTNSDERRCVAWLFFCQSAKRGWMVGVSVRSRCGAMAESEALRCE